MERMKDLGLDILNPIFTDAPAAEDTEILELSKQKAKKVAVVMTKAGVDRKISLEELKAHNTEAEPWFIVNGEVYDGTPFLKAHPGGAESITIVAGEDASEDFMAIHSVVRSPSPLLWRRASLISFAIIAGRKDQAPGVPHRHPHPLHRRRASLHPPRQTRRDLPSQVEMEVGPTRLDRVR